MKHDFIIINSMVEFFHDIIVGAVALRGGTVLKTISDSILIEILRLLRNK